MKKVIFILCIIFLTNTVIAQYGRFPKPQKPDKIFRQMEKERKKDMKKKNTDRINDLLLDLDDYTQNRIIPQMKEWKTKIDTSLSTNDKIFLDSLRILSRKINEVSKELKKEKSRAVKSGNEDVITEDTRIMKDNKKLTKEIYNNLKSLIADYKYVFDPIKAENKQKIEIWEKEASDIAMKWVDSHGYNLTDKEKKRLEEYWKFSNRLNIIKIAVWNGEKNLQ
jgi:hypothetical protein